MESVEQRGDAARRSAIGHELTDLKPRNIEIVAAALAVVVVVVLFVARALFDFYARRQEGSERRPSPLTYLREPTPEPRLQIRGAQELQKLRAAEDAWLTSYGWIDQKAGIVRIPVDRAMELLATRGLPVRPEGDSAQPNGQRTQGR